MFTKAEEGDIESMFIAGKYFIADHIDNKKDIAIKWIFEAAVQGYQEAVDYIDKHRDLFF